MKEKSYVPRPGSKVARAWTAMFDGPVTIQNLGKAMNCSPNNVNSLLLVPLKNRFMLRVKDETGLLHYALGDMPLDDQFSVVDETDKAEAPAKTQSNWNQGKFPSNPFPVSNNDSRSAPSKTTTPAAKKSSTDAVRHAAANHSPSAKAEDVSRIGWPTNTAALSFVREITSQQPASAEFLAGFFSNGELRLSVGEQQLTLCADHQRQLKSFLNQIKEAA